MLPMRPLLHRATTALACSYKNETFKVFIARLQQVKKKKGSSSFTSLPLCVLQSSLLLDHLPSLLFPFITPFSVLSLLSLQPKPENAVTIAVSSRVLFRTEREQKVFEQKGVEEYLRYQIEHENEPFAPGPAFAFVKVYITQTNKQIQHRL